MRYTRKFCFFDSRRLTYLFITPWSRVLPEKLIGSAASQEILRISWNPNVYYRTHKCPKTCCVVLPPETPPRRSDWGSSLPPDCFVPRGSISPCECYLTWFFDGEALLAPLPTPKLEDHPLSAVRDCLFNIFAATLHIGGRSYIRNLRTRHAVVTAVDYS
jgi:hypothetical protein